MDEQNQQQILPPQQPPIPPQNINPVPQPQQSLYGKRNWLKWVLIYLIIAVLIYGGIYYYLAAQQKKSSPYSTNSPIPTIIPSPTPDPTATWKTYKSEKLNIEFKYPPQFSYKENITGYQNRVDFEDKDREFTIDKLISSTGNMPPYLETNKTQVFNGLTWKVLTPPKDAKYCDAGMCGSITLSYYIFKNNSIYNFTYQSEDLRETIEKILASVNFLDTRIVDSQHIQYTQALDVQIVNTSGKIRLYLPKDAVAPSGDVWLHYNSRITFNEVVYDLTDGAHVGLCSEEQVKHGCSFKDEQFGSIKDLRIWFDQNGVIGINPLKIQKDNIYVSGLLITKEEPNRIFTQEEVVIWKTILLHMEAIK